ncbi:MAG TPA: hypothetical protein VK446_13415, partial [Methylocystis sp.]|nr:hypothetical protein [Methylocystis sp.]
MNSVLAEPLGASAIERDRARPRVTDLCIVLRGELFSDTGVARHCRALASLLRPHAKKFGAVSLYAHPSRMRNRVPFPVITDGEIEEFAAGDRLVVINFCSPPDFRRVERAYNVGYFPWETDVFPPREAWLGYMKLMERIWAPSTWQSALVQSLAGLAEAPVIPWPQEAVEHRVEPGAPRLAKITAQRPMTAAQLRNFSLRASPPGARRTEILSEERAFQSGVNERFDPGAGPKLADLLNERRGDAFLAMQTDVPRKGLPLLLSAWMSFKATEEGRDAILVIKHSS